MTWNIVQNITGVAGLFDYANTISGGQVFAFLMIGVLFFIGVMASVDRMGLSRAIATSSFIMSLVAIPFMIAGIVPTVAFFILVALDIYSIFWLMVER